MQIFSNHGVKLANRSRRGFTLIELIVAIGVMTLIATLATSVLHAMLRQQVVIGRQLTVGNSLSRLATRFRADVHAAQQAEADGATITLVGTNSTITYSHSSPGIIRRRVEDDGGTRQDHFDLQTQHEVLFAVEPQARGTAMVTLIVRPPAEDPNAPSREPRYAISSVGMTTLAELARDHRWHGRETGQ